MAAAHLAQNRPATTKPEGRPSGGSTTQVNSDDGNLHQLGKTTSDVENTLPRRVEFPNKQPKKKSNWNQIAGDASDEEIKWRAPPKEVPRQRPLSAPPKAYPFARHSGLPSEQARLGLGVEVGSGTWVGSRTMAGASKVNEPTCRSRGGGITLGTKPVDEGIMNQQRETRSLTVEVNSDTKRSQHDISCKSEVRRRMRVQKRGFGSSEEIKEVPLSPQEFGLRRWKEYAVLRQALASAVDGTRLLSLQYNNSWSY